MVIPSRFKEWKEPYFDNNGFAYETELHQTFIGWLLKLNKIEEQGNPYGWRCQYHDNLKLSENTDIGCFTYINAKYGVEIGENTQIGGGTSIYSEDTIDGTNGKIVIKENCKIGSNSVLLPNVVIGNNSVVGAFSLIKYRQIIPDNEIWFGIPAKKVGFIINEERNYY